MTSQLLSTTKFPLLALDYGERRVGLAVSDPEGRVAVARGVLEHHHEPAVIVRALVQMVQQEGFGGVVLGLPRSARGGSTRVTDLVKEFAKHLAAQISVPVVFEDERLTSVSAFRVPGSGRHVDAQAAVVLLQSYLDRQRQAARP